MIEIYVDGSFFAGCCGYGAVVLDEGQPVLEFSGVLTESRFTDIRQVAGELKAVIESIKWCKENSVSQVKIYFDYKGISCWATGEWRAKNEITQSYRDYVRSSGIKISWVKVAAHSGVKWNERADELAKSAVTAKTGKVPGEKKAKTSNQKKDVAGSKIPPKNAVPELKEFALEFEKYMQGFNYDMHYDQIYNGMYARFVFYDCTGEKEGLIDVYKTAKKNFSPDYRAFKDLSLESEVKNYMEIFRQQMGIV